MRFALFAVSTLAAWVFATYSNHGYPKLTYMKSTDVPAPRGEVLDAVLRAETLVKYLDLREDTCGTCACKALHKDYLHRYII